MKVVLYCDKFLYHKLYMNFPKYDEKNRVIGSLFSSDEFDNFHVQNKEYMNLALNPLDGIRNIYFILIQKSWYSDPNCINICKYAKVLHPETKIIFYMDDSSENHQYFCHRMVTENLGYIATDMNELSQIIQLNFEIDQSKYQLQNFKKSQLKKLQKEFYKS